MAVPDFQSVMLPFLETLQDGKQRSMRDLTAALAIHFQLTEAQLQEHLPSGPQSLFYNRVAWAKTHLKNAGLIENPVRGKVSISEAGRKILRQKPATIDCKFLRQFPTYLTFIGQASGTDDTNAGETVLDKDQTPLELIESSFQTLRKASIEDSSAAWITFEPRKASFSRLRSSRRKPGILWIGSRRKR